MKLTFCLIPRTTAGINARTKLSKKQWDIVRFKCYQDAGYTCEVCDGAGPQHPVECHEQWTWDVKTEVQRLERLVALCPTCHQAVHIGHSMVRALSYGVLNVGAEYLRLLQHVVVVNTSSLIEVQHSLMEHIAMHRDMSSIYWSVNVDLAKNIDVQDSGITLEGFEL